MKSQSCPQESFRQIIKIKTQKYNIRKYIIRTFGGQKELETSSYLTQHRWEGRTTISNICGFDLYPHHARCRVLLLCLASFLPKCLLTAHRHEGTHLGGAEA